MASLAQEVQRRALRQPRRLDLRAVLGIFLLLAATGGSIAFWSTAAETRPVLVARHDLLPGAVLTASDLAVAHVRIDDTIYQAAIPANALPDVIGTELASPVHAQQLLVMAQLSTQTPLNPDQMTLTIPVRPETASGGRIQQGDAVQVLVTTDANTPDSRTEVVLQRVTVHEVGYEAALTVINTSGLADQAASHGPVGWLTLVVTQAEALELTQAKWNGELDVARLPATK